MSALCNYPVSWTHYNGGKYNTEILPGGSPRENHSFFYLLFFVPLQNLFCDGDISILVNVP